MKGAAMLPGWSEELIGGKPAAVFEPPGGARFAVLYLHDASGELPSHDSLFTAELSRHGLACCAPRGGPSWWVDRICPAFDPQRTAERHLFDHVNPWILARWPGGRRGIAAVGVGMGGQGAVRLAFRYPEEVPIGASLAGDFDFHEHFGRGTPLDEMYDSREQCRQDTAILQIHPMRFPPHVWFACAPADATFRGNDRLHEKLSALGLPHTADLETRPGDPRQYQEALTGPMLAFVARTLEQVSRRLL